MTNNTDKQYMIHPVHVLKDTVVIRFDELEQLRLFIESSINEELRLLENQIKEKTKNMTKEEANEFIDRYSDDYHIVDKDFRRHLRYGYISTTYAIIESTLNEACEEIKDYLIVYKKRDIQLDLSDLTAESSIQRARKYLEKVLLLSFPKQTRSWKEIVTLSKVRNCIVHADGYDRKGRLKKYLDQTKDMIKYDDFNRLIIEATYCQLIQENGLEFFKTFCESNKDLLA